VKIKGQYTLPAAQEKVWDALLDPEVLARTLPGCESLESLGDDQYKMRMKLALASVQGLFDGKVSLEDQQPPSSYRLRVSGTGKIGFVNGSGQLKLEPSGDSETVVSYEGEVKVGGMIAAVGQRLLDMTSKMMTKRFFLALAAEFNPAASD
jgi:carbon monoxide dehydrogenase subunit G